MPDLDSFPLQNSMSDLWISQLSAIVDDSFDELVALRRWMHRNPELSGHEFATTSFLRDQLSGHSLPATPLDSGRGLTVDLHYGDEATNEPRSAHQHGERVAGPSSMIGLRADIDALPILDAKTTDYASQTPNVMHACGHDVHSAILFGALRGLQVMAQRQQLPRPISLRGLFQPAEETCAGAKEMIAAGAVDGLRGILATHVDPSRDSGTVGWRCGVLTAHCDEIIITIRGRGGHGARPHETDDPVSAAAMLIQAIQGLVSRSIDSQEPVVVSIGMIRAGSSSNVIPNEVELRGTVRTLEENTRTETLARLDQAIKGVALMSGNRMDLRIGISGPSVENDDVLTGHLREAAESILGYDNVHPIKRPSMGSEDLAFYKSRVPISMIRLGSRSTTLGHHPLHTPAFDVDEQVIAHGSKILATAAIMCSASP